MASYRDNKLAVYCGTGARARFAAVTTMHRCGIVTLHRRRVDKSSRPRSHPIPKRAWIDALGQSVDIEIIGVQLMTPALLRAQVAAIVVANTGDVLHTRNLSQTVARQVFDFFGVVRQ